MESHVDWVLRCRGLPYSITKVEMEKFFDTSTLATNTEDCVQITYNEEGLWHVTIILLHMSLFYYTRSSYINVKLFGNSFGQNH